MESPITPGLWYGVQVLRVIDGDTIRVRIEFGGGEFTTTNVRLLGINAPERRRQTRAAGDRAFLRLVELLTGATVEIRGQGSQLDRYGRILADVRFLSAPGPNPGLGTYVDAGELLLAGGYAVPFAA